MGAPYLVREVLFHLGIGYLPSLLRFTQREDLEEFYQRTVGILVEFDAQQDSHLVPTLEAPANNGQMQKAAESFNIHYNTSNTGSRKLRNSPGWIGMRPRTPQFAYRFEVETGHRK